MRSRFPFRMAWGCALIRDGSVRCWGRFGRAPGTHSYHCTEMPVSIPGIESAVELSIGYLHGCVRLRDGSVRWWDRDQYGPSGDSTLPAAVDGLPEIVGISAGYAHTCAVAA